MAKNKPITIGSHTLIDFPKFGIAKVPAKVDTGADSSSIWASNIRENKGSLSFKLFSPGSEFYTGETITTSDYQFTTIKNSFGHSEIRYKVRLPAKVEGRALTIRFTLANRAENNFPILIGRRTLHGRFLVDVTRAPKQQFSVLILKPKLPNQDSSFGRYFFELEQNNPSIKINFATYKELKFVLKGRQQTVKIPRLGKKVSDFNLVYFLVIGDYKDIASAVAQHLNARGINYIDRAVVNYYQSLNKLHENITLQTVGARVPRSIFMEREAMDEAYDELVDFLGTPFVLKDIHGKRGRLNYLIKDRKDYQKALRANRTTQFIAQKFIDNSGDYRVIVLGGQVRMIIKRTAQKDSHLNNLAKDASAKLVKVSAVPAAVRRLAVRAAEGFNLSIAGVDMMQDKKTGLWYCLEVNENPQMATGSYTDKKQQILADYLIKKLRKI